MTFPTKIALPGFRREGMRDTSLTTGANVPFVLAETRMMTYHNEKFPTFMNHPY